MWKNYLKIALRNIWKRRAFATINVLGLAIGMASCFLMVQYVQHEVNYDQFHSHLDRLYRVNYHINFGNATTLARIPPTVSDQIRKDFPEIETTVRMFPRDISVTVVENQKKLEVQQAFFVDSTIQDVFNFEFLHGHPATAMQHPFSVILTDEMAETLFGTTNVVGKKLRLAGVDNFNITGVIKDWPDQAHMELNMMVFYQNMVDLEPPHAREVLTQVLETNWIASHSYTYALLKENQSPEAVNEKFPAFIKKYGHENMRDKQNFALFPVKDIHVHSTAGLEPRAPVTLDMLYLFMGIGLIILLIACINFINLSTASSLNRAKEVGVRKVLGANRALLISQFLGESFVLSFFAFLLSLLLAAVMMPYLNDLTGLAMTFSPWNNWVLILAFVGIFVLAGLLAGSYPAFYVSKLKAVESLKGGTRQTAKPSLITLPKVLMTAQFLATIAFISGAVIIYLQLQYLHNQPLGFNKELTLQIPIDSNNNLNSAFRPGDPQVRQRMNTLDENLMNNPNIKAVTQCSRLPGFGAVGRPVWTEHVPQSEAYTASVLSVDYDYVETFDLEVLEGREFDVSHGTDHLTSFVVNETAVKSLGYETPEKAIGQKLTIPGKEGFVVGVLKNYHVRSLQGDIQDLILHVAPGDFSYFAVRVENANIPQTLSFIEQQWANFFPEKVFEYTFLDESLQNWYESDGRLMSTIAYFAFIAILIACFGLLGLAALVTQRRFKEMGIHKILGASVPQILNLLAKDFLKLIGIAMVLAIPLTWYFVTGWMENFAYRIDFPWYIPLVIGVGVVILAFITISSQTVRAAWSNPVETLRHE